MGMDRLHRIEAILLDDGRTMNDKDRRAPHTGLKERMVIAPLYQLLLSHHSGRLKRPYRR